MNVEYIQEICKRHSDCKECPLSEIHDDGSVVCVFNGTPDMWDPYGKKRDTKEEKDVH